MPVFFAGIPGVQGSEKQIEHMFPAEAGEANVYELELEKYSYREYIERTVHDLALKNKQYDELVLVGCSMGGIAAIEMADDILRVCKPGWRSFKLLLVGSPLPGVKTLVGAGKFAGVLSTLSYLPAPALNWASFMLKGEPIADRGLGSSDEMVMAAHNYGTTIPVARYARQVRRIINGKRYGASELDNLFDAVGYLGANNNGAQDDGVVDWRPACAKYREAFGDTPFYELEPVPGPHMGIPSYPWAYQSAVREFLRVSAGERP